MRGRILLKFGGSVITDKQSYESANLNVIKNIAKAVGENWERLRGNITIINGAGSFGHAVVDKYKVGNVKIETELHKLGFSETFRACNELSNIVSKYLISNGVPSVFIPPLFFVVQDHRKVVEFNKDIILDFMNEGYLPLSGGNMVNDISLGKSIISGDTIIEYLSSEFGVVAFGTDVDGVYDYKGDVIPVINRDNLSEISKFLHTRKGDYTGAMMGKINRIFNMDSKRVFIFNLNNLDQLRELLRYGEIKSGRFTVIFT